MNSNDLKAPQNIRQLVPWLNHQFAMLQGSLQKVATPLADGGNHKLPRKLDQAQLAGQLTSCLHQAVSCLEQILDRPGNNGAPDISRALLLAGLGARHDATVRNAIREYCDVLDEIARCRSDTSIPEVARDNLLAGFERLLGPHRQTLEALQVEIQEVQPGTLIDPAVHDVVKKMPAPGRAAQNTVVECISPVFRWKNDRLDALEHAKVVAYTAYFPSAVHPAARRSDLVDQALLGFDS